MNKRILDVGCGDDPERWFPGADLCDINADGEDVDFADMCCSSSPLPVPDASYDLIWYSYGWQWVDPAMYGEVAEEMSRVAAPRATIVIKDYCSVQNWDTGAERKITVKQWQTNLMSHFAPFGWTIESLYKEVDTRDILCILSRNWG